MDRGRTVGTRERSCALGRCPGVATRRLPRAARMRTWLTSACLLAILAPGLARGEPTVRVDSKISLHTFLERAEFNQVKWTRSDRQCVELAGDLFSILGPDTIPVHRRIITRLDRHLVWDVDFADSSYTQSSFPNMELAAAEAEMLAVEADSGFAPPPFPIMSPGSREDLGAGDRICGLATVRASRRDRSAPPAPTSGQVNTRVVKWWETRELPGLDLAVRFEATWRAFANSAGRGAADGEFLCDSPGFNQLCGPFVVRHSGYPMRIIVGLEMPLSD